MHILDEQDKTLSFEDNEDGHGYNDIQVSLIADFCIVFRGTFSFFYFTFTYQ